MKADYAHQIVTTHLDTRDILEQVAEEAAEVGQAALKLIRAAKLSKNPARVRQYEAQVALYEEVTDLLMGISLLYPNTWERLFVAASHSAKWGRWANGILVDENERIRDARKTSDVP